MKGSYEAIRESYDRLEVESSSEELTSYRRFQRFDSTFINKLVLFGVIIFLSGVAYISLSKQKNSLVVLEKENIGFADLDEGSRKSLFSKFTSIHKKTYSSLSETEYRYKIFSQNMMIADQRNSIESQNGGTAVHGLTKFSDLTSEEFEKLRFGSDINKAISTLKPIPRKSYTDSLAQGSSQNTDEMSSRSGEDPDELQQPLPTDPINRLSAMNWAGKYTTPIRDQGLCGACWAFTATEQVESDGMRLGLPGLSVTEPLSAQVHPSPRMIVQLKHELLSCDHYQNDTGCNGGWFDSAYQWIQDHGGLMYAKDYRFTNYFGGDSSACDLKPGVQRVVTLEADPETGAFETGFETEADMAAHVLAVGPVNTVLDARPMRTYISGIISSCDAVNYTINHAVQVVGVNVADGYWIVRNSWGADWGMEGYCHVKYGVNMCGITDFAHFTHPKTVLQ